VYAHARRIQSKGGILYEISDDKDHSWARVYHGRPHHWLHCRPL
jgi:hypothetical protein